MSLDFSVTYSFRPHHDPGVDSVPSENKYQKHFLGVKEAGAWGWRPYHLHVPNVMKSGSLNLLETSGPYRACYGTPLPMEWKNEKTGADSRWGGGETFSTEKLPGGFWSSHSLLARGYRRPGSQAINIHLPLVRKLKSRGSVPPIPHIPSRNGELDN